MHHQCPALPAPPHYPPAQLFFLLLWLQPMLHARHCPTKPTALQAMARDHDSEPFSLSRRVLLLLIAATFVVGCAVLALGLRVVPVSELGAVTAALFYVLAASLLQPAPRQANSRPDRIRPLALDRQLSRITVRLFLTASFVLSLLLPWAWIIAGIKNAECKLLGPHLFLMMAQVLFEIWSYRNTVSTFIRIGIPVAFVSYRLGLLVNWVRAAFEGGADGGMRDLAMKALALSNLTFWGVVLFYVLLLKVCPPYFLERRQLKSSGTATQS